ncbi:MAG: ribosome silencing factor [Clostridia bacterium]|nr:ribosome silencing factor [Clostridia bacterium]
MQSEKIYPNMAQATPKEKALEMAKILWEKQAFDIDLYEVAGTTVLCDYVLLCTGKASTHVKTLADDLEFEMGKRGVDASHNEGKAGAAWVLCDFDTIIVHVFDRASRDYYRLDRLLPEDKKIPLDHLTDDN